MRAAATAAAAAAAAATAAAGFREIFGTRDMAEFKGQADIFADLFLQQIEFLLGREELLGDRVFQQRGAGCLELADFGRAELNAGVLFLVQFLAAFVHTLVLQAGGIVVEKTFNTLLQLEKLGVAGDVDAQLPGFHDDGGIFSNDGHGRSIASQGEAGNGQFRERR